MAIIRKAMLQDKGEDAALIKRITDFITCKEVQMSQKKLGHGRNGIDESTRKEVAKKYIAYRDQRSIAERQN